MFFVGNKLERMSIDSLRTRILELCILPSWTCVGSIHGLGWIGFGRKFPTFCALGWVKLRSIPV